MASKENQEALDILCKYQIPKVSYKDDGEHIRKILFKIAKSRETLQKAIYDLELYKKALKITCSILYCRNQFLSKEDMEGYEATFKEKSEWKEYALEQARKELENGK